MKGLTTIQEIMTPAPLTVDASLRLREAVSLMRGHKIRHLPVEEKGKLVGILSDRDVRTAGYYIGTDADFLRVRNVMVPSPYCVALGTSLAVVVAQMAKKKYGCAVVTDPLGKTIGILTAGDALGFLARVLDTAETNSSCEDARRLSSMET
jgi:CBS domain-containing protein